MNKQARHHAKQAVLWAVTAADARAEGDDVLAEHSRHQAYIHERKLRKMHNDAFLDGEFEQVS